MKTCSLLNSENESDKLSYTRYLDNHPQATFEYTLEWKGILERNFGFESKHIVCKDSEGKICGVLPLFKASSIFGKRLVSTPYAIYSGILADTYEVKKEIINFSKKLAIEEKVNFLEIREEKENNCFDNFKLSNGVYNFSLRLDKPIEEIWKGLPKGSVRWGIKKAKKSNLCFVCGNDKQDLDIFYDLFVLTRKFRGVPGYPYDYFKEIMNKLKVKIYTSYLKDKPIASIFLIYYKKEMRYAFAGAVHDKQITETRHSEPEYKRVSGIEDGRKQIISTRQSSIMQLQPYHIILWEAIKDANSKGYSVFNLGGATENTNDGGLCSFKKKWADKVIEVPSYFYLNKGNLPAGDSSPFLNFAGFVWKKMPLSLTKFLSPIVIKQFV
ncbi:lipid II:glycine glycyltransferase FemX [Nanoarchaeota archaeon]